MMALFVDTWFNARGRFIASSMGRNPFPQGLKSGHFVGLIGTTEVVP
jgi:hypothetical protein